MSQLLDFSAPPMVQPQAEVTAEQQLLQQAWCPTQREEEADAFWASMEKQQQGPWGGEEDEVDGWVHVEAEKEDFVLV